MTSLLDNKTYWFMDNESGEEFFVEATNVYLAKTIAKKYFDDPRIIGRVSSVEAEMLGYDTY